MQWVNFFLIFENVHQMNIIIIIIIIKNVHDYSDTTVKTLQRHFTKSRPEK